MERPKDFNPFRHGIAAAGVAAMYAIGAPIALAHNDINPEARHSTNPVLSTEETRAAVEELEAEPGFWEGFYNQYPEADENPELRTRFAEHAEATYGMTFTLASETQRNNPNTTFMNELNAAEDRAAAIAAANRHIASFGFEFVMPEQDHYVPGLGETVEPITPDELSTEELTRWLMHQTGNLQGVPDQAAEIGQLKRVYLVKHITERQHYGLADIDDQSTYIDLEMIRRDSDEPVSLNVFYHELGHMIYAALIEQGAIDPAVLWSLAQQPLPYAPLELELADGHQHLIGMPRQTTCDILENFDRVGAQVDTHEQAAALIARILRFQPLDPERTGLTASGVYVLEAIQQAMPPGSDFIGYYAARSNEYDPGSVYTHAEDSTDMYWALCQAMRQDP